MGKLYYSTSTQNNVKLLEDKPVCIDMKKVHQVLNIILYTHIKAK